MTADFPKRETKEILGEFLISLREANALTPEKTEGLHEGGELGHSDYVENYGNSIFHNTAAELGWSLEELETWYSKNWR